MYTVQCVASCCEAHGSLMASILYILFLTSGLSLPIKNPLDLRTEPGTENLRFPCLQGLGMGCSRGLALGQLRTKSSSLFSQCP